MNVIQSIKFIAIVLYVMYMPQSAVTFQPLEREVPEAAGQG
jgi:hypothetical protein